VESFDESDNQRPLLRINQSSKVGRTMSSRAFASTEGGISVNAGFEGYPIVGISTTGVCSKAVEAST
jgi:hypothetical protein